MPVNKEDIFLLECIRQDQRALSSLRHMTHKELDIVFQVSNKHFLAPFLYHILSGLKKETDIPDYILDKLYQAFLNNTVRNTRTFYTLSKALKQLDKNGIPFILLKGAHLSELVYEDSGLRVMEDIDILFKKEDLKNAQYCLTETGHFNHNSPLTIDPHWYLEQYIDFDMDNVWKEAQTAQIAGVETMVLSPENLIVHLCMHLSFHHQFQFAALRSLCDIKESIRHYGVLIDWDKLENRAKDWKIQNGVYLSLLLSKELVGAKVPHNILKKLKPNGNTDEYKEWAIEQIFRNKKNDVSLSPYFWQIWRNHSFLKKLSYLSELLIPSQEFLYQKYPNSIKKRGAFFYYLVRMIRHLKQYSEMTLRIVFQEESAQRLLKENKKNFSMVDWIAPDSSFTL